MVAVSPVSVILASKLAHLTLSLALISMNVSLMVAKVLPLVKTPSAHLLALVPMDMLSIATVLVVMISTNALMISRVM